MSALVRLAALPCPPLVVMTGRHISAFLRRLWESERGLLLATGMK